MFAMLYRFFNMPVDPFGADEIRALLPPEIDNVDDILGELLKWVRGENRVGSRNYAYKKAACEWLGRLTDSLDAIQTNKLATGLCKVALDEETDIQVLDAVLDVLLQLDLNKLGAGGEEGISTCLKQLSSNESEWVRTMLTNKVRYNTLYGF